MGIRTIVLRIALLSLIALSACAHKGKEDLLSMLLGGMMPFSHTIWSHAGPGNQGANLENTMVSTIGLARTTLECGFQDVNLTSVINAIHDAKARGVAVRVGMDEDNRGQPGFLQLSSFLVSTGENRDFFLGNAGAGQVYTTICTADSTRVFAATASPTIQGFYNQPAFGWYFQDSDQELPRKFQSETDLIGHGSFGSSKQVLNRKNFYLHSDMEVGVYMAPKEGGFESFLVPRVRQARSSIQLFASEFFSNDLDSGDLRRSKDLAYEILNSSVGSKQIVVTSHAARAADPDEIAALNSANYLSNNGIPYRTLAGAWPRNSLNMVVVDGQTSDAQLFVSSFPFSARADSSHDGFLLVFQYRPMVQAFSDFYNQLQARAVTAAATGDNITAANQMEVVISELNWMGGYDSAGTGTTTEYVELYNNTANVINISGWRVECGASGGFATLVSTIPASTIIGPGQFFLLAQSGSALVAEMHSAALSGSGLISDTTTDQCRITDGAANGNTVVDVIGVSGTAFSSNTGSLGSNNTSSQQRRSMERTDLAASGANTSNWHTNSHTSIYQNLNFVADKIYRTHGTPGYYNSPAVPVPPPPSAAGLVINEVIFNQGAVSTNDVVEIYNPTSSDIDLAAAGVHFHRDSGCSLAGGTTTTIALTGTISAGGYRRIAEATGVYAGTAEQTATFNITNGDCVLLTSTSAPVTAPNAATVVDFVAIGRTATDRENSSYAPGGSGTAEGAISRCSNGADTNTNGSDFLFRGSAGQTPGAANSCGNDPRSLKINEVAWNCTSATTCGVATAAGDMVEIYNPTGSTVDLAVAGVRYRRDSSCSLDGAAHTETLALTGSVPAGGYYVIAGAGGAFAPGDFAASTSLTSNHCVLLTQGPETFDVADTAGNLHKIDLVAWGTVSQSEGTPVTPATATPNWIKRCANGTDTNSNSADFAVAGGNISAGSANNCP